MSFVLEYHPLFSVGVEVNTSGKVITDMVFQPTARCHRLLADRHMVFKARENGGQVFYQKNPLADEPLLGRITERTQFTFTLSLTRSDFFALYHPDLSKETGPHLYFDNLTKSGTIQSKDPLTVGNVVQASDAIQIRSSVFFEGVDVSGNSPPTLLTIERKFDPPTVVPNVPIQFSTETNQVLTKIDLTPFPYGLYTVTTNKSNATPKALYIDNDIAKQRVVGIVDIFWEDSQETAPADGVPYVIRFEKR